MRSFSLVFGLAWPVFLLYPAGGAWAGPEGELGLWDCVRYAVSEHPQVCAARWRVAQARCTADEDATLFYPEISAGAHYSAVSYVAEVNLPGRSIELAGHHDTGVSVEARHLLYDWGRRKNKHLGDLRLVRAGSQALGSLQEQLALEAGTVYLEMLGASRQAEISERSVITAEEHHRRLLSLYETGLTTYDEVLKAEVHLDQARIQLTRSRNRVRLARAELLEHMGLPAGSGVSFADTCGDIPVAGDNDRRPERALGLRPALAAYDSRLAALEAAAAGLGADNRPTVSLFASGTAARPGIDMFRKEFIEYARAGVVLDWRPWDWGAKGHRLARLEAQSQELAAGKRDLERRMTLEVERQGLWEQEAGDRLELARKALTAAREHFRLVGEMFDQGQVNNTEYIDAEEAATAGELEVAGAQIDLALARWRVAYVCGLLAAELEKRFSREDPEKDSGENR